MKNVSLVGALTSKPYAFTARSWELKNTDSLDVFDSVNSNIKISTRGSSVLRILPKINDKINEEWITDKARFAYDALKFQRILHCYRRAGSAFNKIAWPKVFGLLYAKKRNREFPKLAKKTKPYRLSFFAGHFSDLETLSFIKNFEFSLKLESSAAYNVSVPGLINYDCRSHYVTPDLYPNVEALETVLLVGCNPRLEAPALNLRLRKGVLFQSLRVLNIGFNASLTYRIENLGSCISKLVSLLEGRSSFSRYVSGGQGLGAICGVSFFQNLGGSAKMYEYMKDFFGWVWMLPAEASTVNWYELGSPRSPSWSKSKTSTPVNLLMGEDKSIFLNEGRFNVYFGHHGDLSFRKSDLVLPSTLFSEKNSTYINYQGYIQRTRFVDSSLLNKDVRDDLVFMKTFLRKSEDLSTYPANRQLSSAFDLKTNSARAPFYVSKTNIHYYMKDFYRNDPISRNSPIMALTSNRLNFKKSSFSR